MRVLLQITQLAFLARLLSPEDYGLMAMVVVVLSFAGLFVDLGINSAYVQQQSITPEQRSSLFWLNVLTGTALTGLVVAASPLLAWLFGDSRLIPLMMLSASTFVLSALGQQVLMAAEKALDFRPVAILEICATLLGFTVALLTAMEGWGVYSLVAAGIASALTSTLSAWLFMARGWRPMLRLNIVEIRHFLSFGSATVANNLVNQINTTVDIFLGGRLLAATQLGFYSVPRNLTLQLQFMINPIITRVGFPLIAQVQSDVPRVKTIYLKTLNMTASTNAPLYLGIAFFAPEIVAIVLGAGWDRSVETLRILALWGGLRSTGNPVGSLLFGMGRADLALKWNLAMFLIVAPALWLGSKNGPEGLAWVLLSVQVGFFVPGWYVLVRPLCQARLEEYATSALKPFLLAGLSILPAYWVAIQLDGPIGRLLVGIVIAIPLYMAVSFRANHEWFSAMFELLFQRTMTRQK
jgi:O-antigen/teichoic acid export membrane protein